MRDRSRERQTRPSSLYPVKAEIASRLTEGQIRFDPRGVRFVDDSGFRQMSFALGVLGREKVPALGMRTQDFAAGGDFEPFRDRFSGFAPRN
jgi:hypothetical protein